MWAVFGAISNILIKPLRMIVDLINSNIGKKTDGAETYGEVTVFNLLRYLVSLGNEMTTYVVRGSIKSIQRGTQSQLVSTGSGAITTRTIPISKVNYAKSVLIVIEHPYAATTSLPDTSTTRSGHIQITSDGASITQERFWGSSVPTGYFYAISWQVIEYY